MCRWSCSCRRRTTPCARPGTAAAPERQRLQRGAQSAGRGPAAQQFHQLPRRQCADPRPRQFHGLRPLSRRSLRAQMEQGIADSIRLGESRQDRFLTIDGFGRQRLRPALEPELARKAALDLAAGGLRQGARPDQRDVAREDLVLVGDRLANACRPSRRGRSGSARCARPPAPRPGLPRRSRP